MSHQIITANRLNDGVVVYLAEAGGWTESIEDSRLATTADDAAALLAEAEQPAERLRVVGPYLMDVTLVGASVRPLSYREVIRANGPSIRTDLGRQAGRGAVDNLKDDVEPLGAQLG